MPKRKTLEEFKKDVYDSVGDEYTVLGEYINSRTKILIKHNKCGCEYLVRPSEFQQGNRCPKCSGLMKKTINEFKQEVFDLVGDEYSVLGKYINNKVDILMRHNKCGFEFNTSPNRFISQGSRCPKCYGNIKNNTEGFKKDVYDSVGDEYTVLGKYINSQTKVLMKHNKCGYEYYVTPNNFQQGSRCPKCIIKTMSDKKRKTTEQFKQEVFDLVGDEYSVLGEYINNETKILMRHNKCCNKFKMRPNSFQQGNRCPKCKESRGEKVISKLLEDNNIEYNTQVIFPDCIYKKNLKFDFQIFIEGSSKIILIEYDGKQHFERRSHIPEREFKEQQLRDNIKNEYCKQQGIHLYRISYKDFNNIENIINDIIEKESSTTIESK